MSEETVFHAGARDSSRQLGRLPPRARQHADAHLLCECPITFFFNYKISCHRNLLLFITTRCNMCHMLFFRW